MNCQYTRERLGSWLDQELNSIEVKQVEEHVKACPDCQKEKVQLERLSEALKSALETTAARVAFDEVWTRVREGLIDDDPWYRKVAHGLGGILAPRRIAWMVPAVAILIVAIMSIFDFLPEVSIGSKHAFTSVDSINSYGKNVGVFRESETRTTVIWLFEDHDDDNSYEEARPDTPGS